MLSFSIDIDAPQEDVDQAMHIDDAEDELPQSRSVLQMLLDASPAPLARRKRASSCPPVIKDVDMSEITSNLKNLDIVEPKTDPVGPSEDDTNIITAENAQTFLDPNACLFV